MSSNTNIKSIANVYAQKKKKLLQPLIIICMIIIKKKSRVVPCQNHYPFVHVEGP